MDKLLKAIEAGRISLKQIQDELDYREMACVEDGMAGWDDDLVEYTTAELQEIEGVFK